MGSPLQVKRIQVDVAFIMSECLQGYPFNSLRLNRANMFGLSYPHVVLVSLDGEVNFDRLTALVLQVENQLYSFARARGLWEVKSHNWG